MKNDKNNSNKPNVVPNPSVVRCAIYARCASDTSRPTSITEQIQRCTEYANNNGWQVVKEFVKSDVAVSGVCLAGRNALQALTHAVEKGPRPFDRLLIDNGSRLSRNLGDFGHVVKRFQKHGVHVVAVSQGLDFGSDSAVKVLMFSALMDEQYLTDLGRKIQRGQQGRVLSGYIAGGRCYGYKHVAVEDPTGTSNYGRPYVIGVRREIVPEQAEIVSRIFGRYASGLSLSTIAHSLNAEHIPAPHGHSKNVWRSSTVASILRNQHYRGVIMWNRTQKTRNPETGRCKALVRPESEWVQIEHPECRIISEQLWEQVQSECQRRRDSRISGFNSTKPRKGAKKVRRRLALPRP